MKVYIGTDHRGFRLKESLKQWLAKEGYVVEDVGAGELDTNDDYPIFAEKVGRAVVSDSDSRGILLCGSGVGAVAAVNKIDGVRGSVGFSKEQVHDGRNDDDMNILVIAADHTSEEVAQEMIKEFIETVFDVSQPRYQRRIDQITELENRD
jgi:RpiB/LacA/LacB family sugar-phosphate isomerase